MCIRDRDNRIKVIHKSNGGVSNARNVAIEQANGEYLMSVSYTHLDVYKRQE